MPRYVIERTYMMPVYQHLLVEADNLEEACRQAIADEDWAGSIDDPDGSTPPVITRAVEVSTEAIHAGQLHHLLYQDERQHLSIPPEFAREE